MREKRFHGDETRWEVFEEVDGKTGQRWYLWVMQSASVVFYRMAPGRGADSPKAHFAKLHKDLVDVVLVGDRYSAYKCLAKDCDDLILAFCWAHVRRDFLKAARSWPELARWMFAWVDDIRELYRLNQARLAAWRPNCGKSGSDWDFLAGLPYGSCGGWIPARIQIDRASTMRGWFIRNRTTVALPVGVKPRRICPFCIHSKCSDHDWILG
jgi:hypothetical protein